MSKTKIVVSVRFDPEHLKEIDRAASILKTTRSALLTEGVTAEVGRRLKDKQPLSIETRKQAGFVG